MVEWAQPTVICDSSELTPLSGFNQLSKDRSNGGKLRMTGLYFLPKPFPVTYSLTSKSPQKHHNNHGFQRMADVMCVIQGFTSKRRIGFCFKAGAWSQCGHVCFKDLVCRSVMLINLSGATFPQNRLSAPLPSAQLAAAGVLLNTVTLSSSLRSSFPFLLFPHPLLCPYHLSSSSLHLPSCLLLQHSCPHTAKSNTLLFLAHCS